tara:strand:- start:106 stop:606 length:501 start_codon:yes stop_codon:yes gene_type:complete
MNELRDDVVDYVVTWAEVHRDTKLLARKLIGTDEWKGIIAVTRGGLVPAAIIAREMDIRNIDTICIATYDEQYIGDVNMIKVPDLAVAEKGESWLMIDDLVDTGATIKAARELLPNCHIATVYAKEMGRPSVDTFVHEVPQNYWVFFPWDTDVQYSAPLHSANGGD